MYTKQSVYQIWYQMKADSITFQSNTRYIHFEAIKFCQTWKTYSSPFLKWKKKTFFPLKVKIKKYFILNCDLFYTKPNKYITFNKSSTSNPLWFLWSKYLKNGIISILQIFTGFCIYLNFTNKIKDTAS